MNKKTLILFLFLAVVAVIAGCQTQESTPPLSASLSELSGAVDMKQAGQDTFAPAASDSVLDANGQIQTGDDGRVRLDLSSGTIIRVTPSSFFTLTSNEEVEGGLLTKIQLEAGKIFIILNGGQADVETPSGVASVRGSYMKVQVDPVTKTIYITCLEGNCSASNEAGSVNFTNGQSVILNPPDNNGNWTPPSVEDMTPEEFLEWLNENPEAKELYDQAMATLTAQAATTEAPTEAPTEEPTEVPTEIESPLPEAGSSNACSQLEEPIDGIAFNKIGQVNFEWTEQPGADYYVLTFQNADGSTARIQTTDPSAQFYIEVLPLGGTYNWFVTAYGSDGAEICTSTSATFSKPQADPTEKPIPADRPEPTEAVCVNPQPNDYCDPESPCYNPEHCAECIIEGVDYCQPEPG